MLWSQDFGVGKIYPQNESSLLKVVKNWDELYISTEPGLRRRRVWLTKPKETVPIIDFNFAIICS